MQQLGMIYAEQQKKESSWAIMGGIADGIAGPAAGVVAAANTMVNNARIREHNAAVRKSSVEMLSGSISVNGNIIQVNEEIDAVSKQLTQIKQKVVLSNPTLNEIEKNINIGKIHVKKKQSGVLCAAVSLVLKKPFALDVPDGVSMVVDGTLKGEVLYGNKLVGDIYFPFPLYGIATNMGVEVTLDGMCGRSVELEGDYTVKITDMNLWIMEV